MKDKVSETDAVIRFFKAQLRPLTDYQRGLINGMIMARCSLAGTKGAPAFVRPKDDLIAEVERIIRGVL